MSDNPSERYRRFARECLVVADTFPSGEQRDVLLQMAQVWQRLADDYADSTILFPSIAGEQPTMQQQQQIQPKDEDKNE